MEGRGEERSEGEEYVQKPKGCQPGRAVRVQLGLKGSSHPEGPSLGSRPQPAKAEPRLNPGG